MEGRVLALLACEGTMRPVNRRREPVMCTENWRTAHSGAAEVHSACKGCNNRVHRAAEVQRLQ